MPEHLGDPNEAKELKNAGYARLREAPGRYRRIVEPGPFNTVRKRALRAVGYGVLWGVRRLPASVRERRT